MPPLRSSILAALCVVQQISAIELDINNVSSIRTASNSLAYGLMSWYHNNATGTAPTAIGTFPAPLYWWEAGAIWGGMIDYWAYSGDDSYINSTTQAILAQVGPDYNFMPPAYYASLGNDDQAFWALASLAALEYGFPVPAGTASSIWLDLPVAVFNSMVPRWDTTQCNGGLRWQIFSNNAGFDYKNTISNGGFFQIAARLARYTGNQTYVDWAEKSWDWMYNIGLISPQYMVFDGTDPKINCTQVDHTAWSYNPAVLLYGTATLYNLTNGTAAWGDRTTGLLTFIEETFFSPYPNATNIMFEYACEPYDSCNNDQDSFKAYLARWMAKSAVLMPSIAPSVTNLLSRSALAAAQSCSGGDNNQTCGPKWYVGGYDGSYGPGQELSALETVQGLLLLANPKDPLHEAQVDIEVLPVTSTFTLMTVAHKPTAGLGGPDTAAPSPTSNMGGYRREGSVTSWLFIPSTLILAFALTGGVLGLVL